MWQVLQLLDADFRASSVQELTGAGSAVDYVRRAAVEWVIAERMRVRVVISVHRVLLGSVSVAEIADVVGSTSADVAWQWRGWAHGQRRLNTLYPRLGLDQREYDQVAVMIAQAAGDAEDKRRHRCLSRNAPARSQARK